MRLKAYYSSLLLFSICCYSTCDGKGKDMFMTDSDSYSDEMYHQLVDEYESEVTKESRGENDSGDRLMEEFVDEKDPHAELHEKLEGSEDTLDMEKIGESSLSETNSTTESYRNAITRLGCDNPWFWNSFKCLWLDVRKRNFVERTRKNAKTVAWIVGPPTVVVLWFVCGFIIVAVFVKSRIKHAQRKIEELRNKYEPGKITLLDGTVKKYPPTEEEITAFEDLIAVLVSLA